MRRLLFWAYLMIMLPFFVIETGKIPRFIGMSLCLRKVNYKKKQTLWALVLEQIQGYKSYKI